MAGRYGSVLPTVAIAIAIAMLDGKLTRLPTKPWSLERKRGMRVRSRQLLPRAGASPTEGVPKTGEIYLVAERSSD